MLEVSIYVWEEISGYTELKKKEKAGINSMSIIKGRLNKTIQI